jgi:hypothetical protein
VFALRRLSGSALALTREHEAIARPRVGKVAWSAFDPTEYDSAVLDHAGELWRTRAVQELHSLTLFTELCGKLQLLGAPLDWSGAFARMIADEVRHTDLCLRLCETLGRPAAPQIDAAALNLLDHASSRGSVRHMIAALFCIGETISGRMFRRVLKVTDVPLARDVVAAIVSDETFHAELGWELGALLMRSDGPEFEVERASLAAALPGLFRHYGRLCGARLEPVETARKAAEEPVATPNFGTLSSAGYALAFFDGMREDVVPGLVSIGLPEAEAAYAGFLAELPASAGLEP